MMGECTLTLAYAGRAQAPLLPSLDLSILLHGSRDSLSCTFSVFLFKTDQTPQLSAMTLPLRLDAESLAVIRRTMMTSTRPPQIAPKGLSQAASPLSATSMEGPSSHYFSTKSLAKRRSKPWNDAGAVDTATYTSSGILYSGTLRLRGFERREMFMC